MCVCVCVCVCVKESDNKTKGNIFCHNLSNFLKNRNLIKLKFLTGNVSLYS